MLHKYLDALTAIRELGSHGGTVAMFDLLIKRIRDASTAWDMARLDSAERILLCAARDRSLAFLQQQRDKVEKEL